MNKIDKTKLEAVMLELGHPENLQGTEYLRMVAALYEPGMSITKELYPAIARAAHTMPSRVERNMRHSICRAWERGSWEAQQRYFGSSVDPRRGAPTVGEYVARIVRVCGENGIPD